MRSVEQFVHHITHARRRTGILLLNGPDMPGQLVAAGVKVIELSSFHFDHTILTDEELIQLLFEKAGGQPTAFLNLELFLGPRFKDYHYLQYLLPKLSVLEPKKPLFFIFYSEVLYEAFRAHYTSLKITEDHCHDEY